MRIEYTGRQLEVPSTLRGLAERKLRKLQRILPGFTHAHVTLHADGHRQLAEVTVHSAHLDLAAAEVRADLGASLKAAIDKVVQQAQRKSERRRDRRRRTSVGTAGSAPTAEREVRVIKSGRPAAKPMTLDEAVLELDGRRDGPLVFRDAERGSFCVLFRRRDGHLGLIEPER
jgi:putative sigma-54 modulation protein